MNRRCAMVAGLAALAAVALCVRAPAAGAGASGLANPAQVKTQIRAILAGKDYRWEPQRQSAISALAHRIGAAIGRLIDRLRSRFSRATGPSMPPQMSQVLFWTVFAGLVVFLLALLLLLVRAAWHGARGRPQRRRKPRVLEAEEVADPTAAEPNEWLTAARQAAEAGDFRRAYRAAFMALLVALDRRGAIRWHRSRTNGDYLRDLRSAPDLQRRVRPLASQFDAVWYGHAPVHSGDVHRCLEVAEACFAGSPEGAAGE